MSSEHLASAQTELKGDLGASWNILDGASANYTDLGVARRFGGAAAAYSLRDIGAMNAEVVKVRRDVDGEANDPEINFSANQVSSGVLEDWVNGKFIDELPADKFNGVTVVVSHDSLNSGASTTIQFYKEDNFTTSHNNPRFKSNDGLYQIFYGSGSGDWIFELMDTGSGATQYARSVNANVDFPYNVTDNGGWTAASGTLNSITVTATTPAAAAFSLRKVNSAYGEEVVLLDGLSEIQASASSGIPISPSSESLSNGLSVKLFMNGGADSFSATKTDSNTIKITLTKASNSDGLQPRAVVRFEGLTVGKHYLMTGEVAVTSIGSDANSYANFDISDANHGNEQIGEVVGLTDGFVPFSVGGHLDASSSSAKFADIAMFGADTSTTGTLTAEFRNIKIIENPNIAVRIRRSSDDVEATVGFDSEDKVSLTSPIKNQTEGASTTGGGRPSDKESGSTNATDLNGFLNEVLTVGVAVPGGNGSDRPDSFTNATNSSFTASVTEVAGGYFPYRTNLNDVIVVSFDIVLTGSDASPSLTTSNGASAIQNKSNSIVISSSGSYTETLTCDQNGGTATHIRFADSHDGTFAVTNFRVVSHTHSAFVHTWYDQAGANNAVQETAANQPRVATLGALLTDGLEFDSDFLQTSSQVLTGTHTGANSMYVVVKQTSADNGYICGSAGSGGAGSRVGQSLFSSNTNDLVVLTDGTDGATDGTLDNISRLEGVEYLISANYSNNNTDTLKKNANDSGYANGTNAYTFSAGSTFSIGTFGNSTVSGNLFAGSMKEIIVYDSDQSDNRFKIESNINNHYSLYNDENETSATAFSFDGERSGGTSSSNGLDGFTLDVQTASAFAGFQLKNKVANTDDIFVSFNAVLTGGSGGASTPQFKLRSGTIGGSATSNTYDVVAGFNATKITSSNDDAEFISFSEGDDNRIFTISDFKVSRIARNGFVETWYDQSGSGNDATQITANQQPAIVQNGGICRSNGSPSLRFDGSDDELDFTDLTLTDATVFNVINFDTTQSSGIVLGGSAPASSGGSMIPFMLNSSSTSVYVNASAGSQFVYGASVTFGTRAEARTALRLGAQVLYTIVDLDVAEADTLDGIGRTPSDQASHHPLAHYNEVIIYNSDLSSDRETIESDIANHYNLTLF